MSPGATARVDEDYTATQHHIHLQPSEKQETTAL
jgi:hypothetical protein